LIKSCGARDDGATNMAKPFETWTVFPHGPIQKIHENLWRVEAGFPGAPFPRTMILARLGDGRVIVHNAIALEDASMAQIEAWGRPSFLIVPNGGHRMDAKIFKARYASLEVVAPPGSKAKVEGVVKVDATSGAFGDEGASYEILGGTKQREGVLAIASAGGKTLVFNDALMNMRSLPGFGGFMMGLFGFTGPSPKVTFPARMALVADKKALRGHLEKLAETPGLTRIEVGHGAPVTENAAAALRAAAAAL
jgi:hypothetical protein